MLSDSDGRSENMPMTLNELSVYMKEQEQMRIEKEREDGKIKSLSAGSLTKDKVTETHHPAHRLLKLSCFCVGRTACVLKEINKKSFLNVF